MTNAIDSRWLIKFMLDGLFSLCSRFDDLHLFTELTLVTYGECNDDEGQRFVYCSSSQRSSRDCNVEGLTTLRTIMLYSDTTSECFMTRAIGTPYEQKIDGVPYVRV